MLFAVGMRPSAGELERLLSTSARAGPPARVSHRSSDEHGRLELLASGLTFDVAGLVPGDAAPIPSVGQVYGLPADIDKFEFEAISITPGAHIAAGGALMPVVRMMVGLAADLALQLPVTAVCWHPALSWMEPKYFGRVVVQWLSGGSFPVLGLTGVRRQPNGAVASSGLSYFIGQEVWLADEEGETASETVQLAARIIDHLVREGPISKPEMVWSAKGEALALEPSLDGRTVMVSRSA